MKTSIIPFDTASIPTIIQLLESWDVVVLPTETIYWIFADWTNEEAVRKIFFAKERPADNPLILHVSDEKMIDQYAVVDNIVERTLIEKLMPWPFTLVLLKRDKVPDITTWSLDTVCVRIPDHHNLREVIHKIWIPLAWPSANRSGRPSPTTVAMVMNDMDDRVPLIADGWSTLYGIESTVARVVESTDPRYRYSIKILRPWFITKEDIEVVVWSEVNVYYDDITVNESPGTRYRHYSPAAPVQLRNPISDIILPASSQYIAFILTQETIDKYPFFLDQLNQSHKVVILLLWSRENLLSCAQRLYQLYAQCDELWVDAIIVESLPEYGVWYALMNRIRKSSTG